MRTRPSTASARTVDSISAVERSGTRSPACPTSRATRWSLAVRARATRRRSCRAGSASFSIRNSGLAQAPRAHRAASRDPAERGAYRCSGQMRHLGARAVQIAEPRSISAELQSLPRPARMKPAAAASISLEEAGRSYSGPNRTRRATRRTFVSTAGSSRSKAKARIAAAVYGPTPGSPRSAGEIAGQHAAVEVAHRAREAVQAHRAAVVAEALPRSNDVAGRRRCQLRERPKGRDEPFERRDDAIDLGLLQHELADHDAIRRAVGAPRQHALDPRIPVKEQFGGFGYAHEQRLSMGRRRLRTGLRAVPQNTEAAGKSAGRARPATRPVAAAPEPPCR